MTATQSSGESATSIAVSPKVFSTLIEVPEARSALERFSALTQDPEVRGTAMFTAATQEPALRALETFSALTQDPEVRGTAVFTAATQEPALRALETFSALTQDPEVRGTAAFTAATEEAATRSALTFAALTDRPEECGSMLFSAATQEASVRARADRPAAMAPGTVGSLKESVGSLRRYFGDVPVRRHISSDHLALAL